MRERGLGKALKGGTRSSSLDQIKPVLLNLLAKSRHAKSCKDAEMCRLSDGAGSWLMVAGPTQGKREHVPSISCITTPSLPNVPSSSKNADMAGPAPRSKAVRTK